MKDDKSKEALFERVFLWSYIPKNLKGVSVLALLLCALGGGIGLISLVGWLLGVKDVTFLQMGIGFIGLVLIQRFVMRNS